MVLPIPPDLNQQILRLETDIVDELNLINPQAHSLLLDHLKSEIDKVTKTLKGQIESDPAFDWVPRIRRLKEQLLAQIRNLIG